MKRLPTPCSLRREHALVGRDLEQRLSLVLEDDTSAHDTCASERGMDEVTHPAALAGVESTAPSIQQTISTFEKIFITCPPIFEALLLHLPTPAILDLYHTSHTLRKFLQSYPLAWKNLSFRLLTPPLTFVHPTTGSESPDGTDRTKKPYALDLLFRVIMPYGKRLTRLDLDNTSVSGSALRTRILEPQRATLMHLSVRGCKDVSLKYHILPFLQEEVMTPPDLLDDTPLAMKSLYTYRCRHHRRRPYLPSSLLRRDSDSQPTHQLIELCHVLNIWTDTAWCPTPGPRCFRRKDYYSQRTAMHPAEVWVPFDRLWRSQNFIGSADDDKPSLPEFETVSLKKDCERAYGSSRGRLWEEQEYGWAGEPLGLSGLSEGEGKETPAHLRRSHLTYINGFKCDSCSEKILERCEQCSVRMHCMGCRKTLCPSCAFDRPIKRKRRRVIEPETPDVETEEGSGDLSRSRSKRRNFKPRDRFWWAPGAQRSPNLMQENSQEDESSNEDDDGDNNNGHNHVVNINRSPRLDLKWCCLEPSFSGGGGIAFIGSSCGDNVRAAPLPQGQGFEDTSFTRISKPINSDEVCDTEHESQGSETSVPLDQDEELEPDEDDTSDDEASESRDFDIFPYLEQATSPQSTEFQKWSSPRSLCKECYVSTKWRIKCSACDFPICIDHDVKTLKVRRCGYRRLMVERMHIQSSKTYLKDGLTMPKNHMLNMMAGGAFYAKWRPIVAKMLESDEVKRLGETNAMSNDQPDPNDSTPAESSLSQSRLFDGEGKSSFIDHYSPSPQPGQLPSTTKAQILQLRPRSLSLSALSRGSTNTKSIVASSVVTNTWNVEQSSSIQTENNYSKSNIRADELVETDVPSEETDRPAEQSTSNSVGGPLVTPAPVWAGCSRYFCLEREAFDRRPPCSGTALKECTLCTIRVCYICLSRHAPCPCTACTANGFLCPNCATRPDVLSKCCHEEEEKQRIQREAEEEEKRRQESDRVKKNWEESREEREWSDCIYMHGGEFWRSIEGNDLPANEEIVDLFGDIDDEQWLLEVLFEGLA